MLLPRAFLLSALLLLAGCGQQNPAGTRQAGPTGGGSARMPAVGPDGLPSDGLFTFEAGLEEQGGSRVDDPLFRTFPGNLKLGPFRLGMTLAQVEALLSTRSDLFSAPADAFGLGSTDCDPRIARTGRTRIYRFIPLDIGIQTRSGGHYALQFHDIGGTIYLSSIYWNPPLDRYSKSSWLALLAKRFGPYSGTVSPEDTLRVHWCTRGEEGCGEDGQRDLPELIMNSDSNEANIAIELRAGRRFEGGLPAALTPRESAAAGTCRLAPNAGPEGLFDQYLLGLSQPTKFGTAAAYREKMLPTAVRAALPADGYLRWARRQGSAWLIRWTMPGEDHGVDVEVGVDIYLLLQPAGRAYRVVWTGDEAAFRKKFGVATRPMLREGLGPA